ncbi:uncharacterized protein [Spinacia oleracea]|uniref:Uncharacterized protein isoform X2 n=1 Tax=Spinacia oleracea TaxID=3562 RepID=A0A9R0HTY9_SPIOL|nr:uncharacterized protein LOC110776729 isoform X2 [Spinacia oleracea]
MEAGQSSSSNSSDEVWAKLVPSDSSYASIEISSDDTIVCSQISSTPDKLEWCQIIRNSDRCSATIRNKSSNLILVDGAILESEDVVGIKCGCEIVPASTKKEYLSFKFEVMPVQEQRLENKLKIFLDSEHTKCSICLNVWHDVVTVAPCLHNFCNGCFSEWLKRCQKKHSNVLCPHCRAVVQFVGRNHFLHGIEEDILQADVSLRRSAEELAILDSYATIKSSLVITNGKKNRQKRARSPIHEEREEMELPCPQCGVGCDKTFCGAYWHAQGVARTDQHPTCELETFRPISERRVSIIPSVAHERNQFEQDITNRCIRQMGTTLQEVISDWVTKLDNREIDRSSLHLRHPEIITAGTHVCNDCYNTVVSFLLYWYRISLPVHLLPLEASNREDCWYGHACRTQHHSVDHARKRNHVCRPTRGSQR